MKDNWNEPEEKEQEQNRAWLQKELENAGKPSLPPSLSAAALFARMDAEDAENNEEALPAPEKKQSIIWVQWRRWGSIAAVLVLAVGVTFLLKGGLFANKSLSDNTSSPETSQNDMYYGANQLPGEEDDRIFSYWGDDNGNQKQVEDGEENSSAPNPNTAGSGTMDENPSSEFGPSNSNENTTSKILTTGELPTPDLSDFDAMAAVSSQLFGSDYEQVYAMFYDSGERWANCVLPTECAHYFLLDKTLYGFFPEETQVVNYNGGYATVLGEDEAAMLSAILQIS